MAQHPKANEEMPQCVSLDFLEQSDVDLTKICWTQLLREIPELVGPPWPFDALADDYLAEGMYL